MLKSLYTVPRPWTGRWPHHSACQQLAPCCRYRQRRKELKEHRAVAHPDPQVLEQPAVRAAGPPAQQPSTLQHFLDTGARMTRGAHHAWAQIVGPGDTVVDATCGNGNDTLYLSTLVGPTGHVYAFDIQEAAIRSASYVVAKNLRPELTPELKFIQQCHSTMQEHVQGPNSVKLVCFNLGYFPGSNKDEVQSGCRIVTQPDTTIAAITAALDLLQEGGAISILAYSGHPGGMEEFLAVQSLAGSLSSKQWVVSCTNIVNRAQAPVLFLFYKLHGKGAAKTTL